MDQTIIRLNKLSAVKGSKKVLNNLEWTTHKGEHWFILGNNGSGKSTLLEIVMGYHWPLSGDVCVFGQTYGQSLWADIRQKIGFVAPWVVKRNRSSLTVYDVIASGVDASIGLAEDLSSIQRKKIAQQAKFFKCEAFLRSKFAVLSSGEQMRVVLARAMVNEPELLILDEPFAHLDIRSRIQMYQLLDRLARLKQGPQLILVTHYLQDVGNVFTHGLVLKAGRIVWRGSRHSLFKDKLLAKYLDVPQSWVRRLEVAG